MPSCTSTGVTKSSGTRLTPPRDIPPYRAITTERQLPTSTLATLWITRPRSAENYEVIVVFITAPRGGWDGGVPRVAGTLAVEKLRTKLARGEERARKLREKESAPRSELLAAAQTPRARVTLWSRAGSAG